MKRNRAPVRWWNRWRVLSAALALWDRSPGWIRGPIVYLLAAAFGTWIAVATGALLLIQGAVREYWPLMIISTLAGAGAGIPAKVGLDRLAKMFSERAHLLYVGRVTKVERLHLEAILPNLPEHSIELLQSLLERPRALTKEEETSALPYLLQNNRTVEVVLRGNANHGPAPNIWGVRPTIREIVGEWFESRR